MRPFKNELFAFLFLLFLLITPFYQSYAQNCSVNAGSDISYCETDVMELKGNVSVVNIDASTLSWSIISQPAGANIIIDNPNSANSTISGTQVAGSYTFEISILCTDLVYATDQVTLTIVDGPAYASVASSMNADCYSGGGINITGFSPGSGETVLWQIVYGEGTLTNSSSNTVTFFPDNNKYTCQPGSNGFKAKLRFNVTKNGCTISDDIEVNYSFGEDPFFVEATPEVSCSLCTELWASCNLDGTGTWTYTGPGTATFANGTSSPNGGVCVDTEGEYTFTWTVSGGCRSGSDQVTVSFNDFGATPIETNAGNGGSWCSYPSTFVLNADVAGVGQTGSWKQVNGLPATITDANSANTTVTGISSGGGPYSFAWTITPDGGGFCSVSDTVTFWETPAWEFEPRTDYGCPSYYYSSEAYFVYTEPYPWDGFDSVDLWVTFHEAPVDWNDTVIFAWSYVEMENEFDNSGSDISLGRDTAIIGIPTSFTVSRSWLLSQVSESYRDEDFFLFRTILIGNNGNYPTGYYEYTVEIADACSTYTYDRNFNYSAKNGFDSPNAGTDIVLSCGTTSTSLAGTGVYNASPEVHRAIWSMVSGPGASPLTAESARSTNPVLSGLVAGTYVFRYTSDFGPECNTVYDEVKVVVSANPPTISSVAVDNPGFCGTGPVDIKALYSNDVHPDSVSWSITNPAVTTETLSDTTGIDSSILTLTNLLTSTSYTVEIRVANPCGVATQTVNFSTGSNTGPTQAEILTDNTCTSTGLVTLEAAVVTSGAGTWSIISEPPGSVATIDDPSANPTTITGFTNLTEGRWVIQFEVSNAPTCTQTSKDSIIIARGTLDTPNAGPDLNFCGVSLPYIGSMQADDITASEQTNLIYGEWRFYSGPGVPEFDDLNDPNTNVTFDTYGEYLFAWVSTSGISCLEEEDLVVVTVGEGAPAAFAGTDQTRCGGSGFALDALDLAPGESGNWSVVSSTGNAYASFADATDPNTTVDIMGAGDVVLRWSTFSNTSGCPANADELTLSYTPAAAAGDDQTLCDATVAMLNGNDFSGLSGATVSWSMVSGPNTPTIDNTTDYTTSVSGLTTGTYIFQYAVTNGGCTDSDNITLEVDALPTANAGDDFMFCGGETVNLSGNTPGSGESSAWALLIGGGSGSFGDASAPSTTYGLLSSDSDFYLISYTVDKGACSVYDYVEGARLRDALLSLQHTDPTCGNSDGAIDLTVDGDDGSLSFLWTNGPTTEDQTGLAAGTYGVTVSHPSGCTASLDTILVNSDGPQISSSAPTICPNIETTVTPTVTGGTSPYTFLWASGETTPGSDITISGDSTITLTITDNAGCSNPAEIWVTAYEVASLSLGSDIYNCGGGEQIITPQISSQSFAAAFYTEDFESDLGVWAQAGDDDADWIRDGYGTLTSGTGPSSGNGDTWYVYTEASSNFNAEHVLTSSGFDLSSRNGVAISFGYHMYGSSMGSLELLASTDSSSWTSMWSISGNQGDSWYDTTVSIGVYDGQASVYLRFVGTTGNGVGSDLAIDNISLSEAQESFLWSTGETTSGISVDPPGDALYYVDVTDVNGCFMSDTVSVFVDCIFPVEWLDFTVEQKDAHALLSWSTAREVNNDFFVIERSIDKRIFQTIGTVNSQGGAQLQNSYDFTDLNIDRLGSPVLVYRIRQVDKDGAYSYSETREIELAEASNMSMVIYPNPAKKEIFVRYSFNDYQANFGKKLIIYDVLGHELYNYEIPREALTGELSIAVNEWRRGNYYVVISSVSGKNSFMIQLK